MTTSIRTAERIPITKAPKKTGLGMTINWNSSSVKHWGDTPTADETRKAWQTFIRRHRIRHQSIRRIMILGIAAAVIALALVFQPLLQPEQQEVEVFTSLEVPEGNYFSERREKG